MRELNDFPPPRMPKEKGIWKEMPFISKVAVIIFCAFIGTVMVCIAGFLIRIVFFMTWG